MIATRIKINHRAVFAVLWDLKATRNRQVLKVSKGISVAPVLREIEGNRTDWPTGYSRSSRCKGPQRKYRSGRAYRKYRTERLRRPSGYSGSSWRNEAER